MVYLWMGLGVVFGSIITSIMFYIFSVSGTLKIDHSNPDKDVYRIEFDSLDKLSRKRHVVLKIDNNVNLSQN